MKQSKELAKFYRLYLKQVKRHRKRKSTKFWFDYTEGLCCSLELYDYTLKEELKKQFKKAGLDRYYPFGEHAYVNTEDLTTDENRIRWVKEHLKRKVKKTFEVK